MSTVTKMRLSKETYSILKNFAAINSNILIQPGNVLKTVSAGRNIYVEAKIAEEFDVDVPIWDLNKFLGVISMFANPDLEFHDNHVVISNGRSSVTYYYSEPSLLTVPTKELKMPKSSTKFDLDEKDLNEILKAASILQVSDLRLVGGDGQLVISVDDSSQSTSNSFEIVIDENYTDKDFEGTINVSEIKFIPGSYTVELTDTIISKFTHKSLDLSYYIAIKRG
jgi:gp45 sliding clamp, C terminal